MGLRIFPAMTPWPRHAGERLETSRGLGIEPSGDMPGEGGDIFEHPAGERTVNKALAELLFDDDKNLEEAQGIEPERLERSDCGNIGDIGKHFGDFSDENAFDFGASWRDGHNIDQFGLASWMCPAAPLQWRRVR